MELKFLPAGTVLEACWHGVDDGIPEVEDRRRAPEGGAKIVPIPGRNVLDGLPDLHDQLCRAETRGVRVTSRRAQTVREERQPGLNFLCCDDQLQRRRDALSSRRQAQACRSSQATPQGDYAALEPDRQNV